MDGKLQSEVAHLITCGSYRSPGTRKAHISNGILLRGLPHLDSLPPPPSMACKVGPSPASAPLAPLPSLRRTSPLRVLLRPLVEKRQRILASAAASGPEGVAGDEEKAARIADSQGPSSQSQLDLLEQLMPANTSENGYESDENSGRYTIREQLSALVGDDVGEFTIPLGKKFKASLNSLTISQKRNIKRHAYLNEVSRRNDSVFFATIGAFVILPPFAILAIAVATGYVELFP